MDNCIFCKIREGIIPSHKIFEDEHVLAFLDISQTTKGHSLVIPKKHIPNVFEMGADDMAHVFSVVPRIANALAETFGATGMNIVSNNHEVAGQTVFHFHVHLIPRYDETDTFAISYTNNMSTYPQDVLKGLQADIAAKMGDN